MFLAPWLALQQAPGTVPARDAGDGIPTLRELAALDMLSPLHAQGAARATERIAAIEQLALRATEFATMDYDFLFDKVRRQLVIGYNVADRRCDTATTICWPRKRDCAISSPSPKERCRRKAGLRWGDC